MGFAGQLSLGHALYLGVGAYSAAALYFHFGIGPWAGIWLALLLCVVLAVAIGALRFSLRHIGCPFHFADHRLCRVHAHRLRSLRLDRRIRWHVFQSCPARSNRSAQSPRHPRDVLLRHAHARRRGFRIIRVAGAQSGGILLAGDPRK